MAYDVLLVKDAAGNADLPELCSFADNDDTILQAARIRLMTAYGEWVLDNTVGIPFAGIFSQKVPQLELLDILFQSELERVEDVVGATVSTSYDYKTQKLSVNAEVRLSSGTVTGVIFQRSSVLSGI